MKVFKGGMGRVRSTLWLICWHGMELMELTKQALMASLVGNTMYHCVNPLPIDLVCNLATKCIIVLTIIAIKQGNSCPHC